MACETHGDSTFIAAGKFIRKFGKNEGPVKTIPRHLTDITISDSISFYLQWLLGKYFKSDHDWPGQGSHTWTKGRY